MGDFVPLIKTFRGVQHYMRTNDDGSHTFAASQDCTAVIERNRAMRNHNDGYNRDRTMRRVGSIPAIVELMWLNQGVDIWNPDHRKEVVRRLNDSDWSGLRSADGVIAVTQDGGFR